MQLNSTDDCSSVRSTPAHTRTHIHKITFNLAVGNFNCDGNIVRFEQPGGIEGVTPQCRVRWRFYTLPFCPIAVFISTP